MTIFYKSKISNVVDADTFDLDVELGFDIMISIRVRLLGCDAPEMRGEERADGKVAKQYMLRYLDKSCLFNPHSKDSFGRWLGIVKVDELDLSVAVNIKAWEQKLDE